MELYLDNIGIIKKSKVEIDGLTVITGKNNSGKTTVGKVVYSLIRSYGNLEKEFERSRNAYIFSKLNEVASLISARRTYLFRLRQKEEPLSDKDSMLLILGSQGYFDFSSEKLISFLHDVNNGLLSVSYEDIWDINKVNASRIDRDTVDSQRLYEQFEERKQIAIKTCSGAINTVEDLRAYDMFSFERLKTFLNLSFCNQINPVRDLKAIGYIRLDNADKNLVELKIRNKSDFEVLSAGPIVLPYTQSVFIDDPFIVDHLQARRYNSFNYSENENAIYSLDAVSHRDYLMRLLLTKAPVNFFDNLELQNKYNAIFDKINGIVPGEFKATKEGMFYVDDNAKLNVQNLATGSKLFFIIKILLLNGILNDETVLILDEPESHLHPEWINKFAEILVLLIRELKLRIMLTTHSPNLLLALESYVKTYAIKEQAHFYLARPVSEEDWASCLECIDDHISKGYAHLSLPLIEMSIMEKAAEEKEY